MVNEIPTYRHESLGEDSDPESARHLKWLLAQHFVELTFFLIDGLCGENEEKRQAYKELLDDIRIKWLAEPEFQFDPNARFRFGAVRQIMVLGHIQEVPEWVNPGDYVLNNEGLEWLDDNDFEGMPPLIGGEVEAQMEEVD